MSPWIQSLKAVFGFRMRFMYLVYTSFLHSLAMFITSCHCSSEMVPDKQFSILRDFWILNSWWCVRKKNSQVVIELPHRGRSFCDLQKVCFWPCLSYRQWRSSLGLLHQLSSSSTGLKVYYISYNKLSYLAVSCMVILSIQPSNTWYPKILLKKNNKRKLKSVAW